MIIYKSKYGATSQYAQWLAKALDLPVKKIGEITDAEIVSQHFIILGSSVYVGQLLVADWIQRNEDILRERKVLLFVVCGSENAKDHENIFKQNIPEALIDRANVFFLPGRLVKSKLSWKDRLKLSLGARLVKNPEIKKAMLQDKDNVKEENLCSIISRFRTINSEDKIR